jgi:hypothetical protein
MTAKAANSLLNFVNRISCLLEFSSLGIGVKRFGSWELRDPMDCKL